VSPGMKQSGNPYYELKARPMRFEIKQFAGYNESNMENTTLLQALFKKGCFPSKNRLFDCFILKRIFNGNLQSTFALIIRKERPF